MIFGGDPDPCKHGMFAFGLHAIVGVSTSCTVVDRRTGEEKEPTGNTLSQEAPVAGRPIEFRLAAKGEAAVVQSTVTDASGRASVAFASLVRNYRDYPADLEATIRATAGGPSETVRIETETARAIYRPVAEERAGDRALAEGRGLIALEHFSRALAESPEPDLARKVAATYRSLPVKPPVPEATRRLLVQAETLSKNNDAAAAIGKLREAIRAVPWLPTARYNLAMALSMEKDYAGAIAAMNDYLALAPDAPDARQARDKIYEWETLAPVADRSTAGTPSRNFPENGGRKR
jgi:tetratricopeptide (TPR) repeat protein